MFYKEKSLVVLTPRQLKRSTMSPIADSWTHVPVFSDKHLYDTWRRLNTYDWKCWDDFTLFRRENWVIQAQFIDPSSLTRTQQQASSLAQISTIIEKAHWLHKNGSSNYWLRNSEVIRVCTNKTAWKYVKKTLSPQRLLVNHFFIDPHWRRVVHPSHLV